MVSMTGRVAAGLFLAALGTAAAQAPTGPQILTFHSSADGTEQPYSLYVPADFDGSRQYPLVVSLHSEESDHRLNLRQVLGVPSRMGEMNPNDMRYAPSRRVEFFVVCPRARGSIGYEGLAERDVYDALADVERRYPIDRDRVYLTGISMGGGGALRLALTRPDIWAAVAPLCPIAEPGFDALAGNALDLPVRIYHGEDDPIVPAAKVRALHRRLVDAGDPAEYIEYPGVRHNVWDFAYKSGAVFDWFAQQKRQRYPARVRLTTERYEYGGAYWVRIDGMTPGSAASIEVTREVGNAATVKTHGVDAFTLRPERALASVDVGGTTVRVRSGAVSLRIVDGKWRETNTAPSGEKGPGAEGPIAAAFAGRCVYVYGTRDAAAAGEAARRRAVAETAARWENGEVKADVEVTAEDIASANLILFGTAATNATIARLAPLLPLALSPGAADYGLVFVAAVEGRYVVVNSGLPWWTGAAEAVRGGDEFQPMPLRVAGTFGDFVLFRGSLEHVVAEGHFDRWWRVPKDAAVRMAASGTVTFRTNPQ